MRVRCWCGRWVWGARARLLCLDCLYGFLWGFHVWGGRGYWPALVRSLEGLLTRVSFGVSC